ncbi:hypothetical protein K493DRAFT_370013 [Basidiobolus meristosporus CBS 931.73]|uniref:BTB domain-containing protein n=1 Tax=Basidiobolus meristosporus CBS 931.73 TaxID=1314790 RepID=A0A1Y1YGU7_9FUNG|nr:hypothetical protein K493DRAFT_370013 [Basidiobolus meristosporus CBS 931.73]|eukprot:ORX97205.1 hypothetical protein K493DRAFT_370013 [Basidiobolus meristosporus CBS 931.73]
MHISYGTNVIRAAHSQDHLSEYPFSSMATQSEFPPCGKFDQEYIRTSENEIVSKSSVLHNLHRMGHILFNNPHSTNTRLHVEDKNGSVAAFWVHDFYFLHDSPVLYKSLHPTSSSSPMLRELESFHQAGKQMTTDSDGKHHSYLVVPSVEGFEEILWWIYTRDDDRWLHTMSKSGFGSIMENVAFLRLSQDAYYVMAEFYEDSI